MRLKMLNLKLKLSQEELVEQTIKYRWKFQIEGVQLLRSDGLLIHQEKEVKRPCQSVLVERYLMLVTKLVPQLKKEKMYTKWLNQIEHLLITGGKK